MNDKVRAVLEVFNPTMLAYADECLGLPGTSVTDCEEFRKMVENIIEDKIIMLLDLGYDIVAVDQDREAKMREAFTRFDWAYEQARNRLLDSLGVL